MYFLEYLLRIPSNALVGNIFTVGVFVASVQLKDVIDYAIVIHGVPLTSKRSVIAKVKRSVYLPMRRYLEWSNNVSPLSILVMIRIISEFFKECSLCNRPISFQPHFAKFWRKCLQLFYVVRVISHQSGIVRYLRLYKHIIVGVFSSAIVSVNEEPLNERVSFVSGVHRCINSLREIVNASHTSR